MIKKYNPLSLNSSGFTLLEVAVAVLILSTTVVGITSSIGGASKSTFSAKYQSTATILAQSLMTQAELDFEKVKDITELEAKQSGDFEGKHEGFRWERAIKEIKFEIPKVEFNLGEVEDESGMLLMKMITDQLTKFLPKVAREVTVTVYWKFGKNESNFVLSTILTKNNVEFVPSMEGLNFGG